MTDSSFPSCAVNRPSGGSADGRMYLVNHYLDYEILGIDIPNVTAAGTTNGETSILAQVNECNALYDRYPNFIIVSPPFLPLGRDKPFILKQTLTRGCYVKLDWISTGDFLTVQNYLNGVGTL